MRPTKEQYYLNIAREVATRATCIRRKFGAIIVKNDTILSTGYTGAPRKTANCIDLGVCPRKKAGIPPGQRYELCRSVHAEMNAIINAARSGVSILGGTMYVYMIDLVGDAKNIELRPCKLCRRMIINAGIKEVIMSDGERVAKHKVEDWIKEEDKIDLKSKGY